MEKTRVYKKMNFWQRLLMSITRPFRAMGYEMSLARQYRKKPESKIYEKPLLIENSTPALHPGPSKVRHRSASIHRN